jgi:hypothetical protein
VVFMGLRSAAADEQAFPGQALREWARARERRERTVPMSMPQTCAASAYESSESSQRISTSR